MNSGVTTLKTTTGGNTYSGTTTLNRATLMGGVADAFSAASPTLVNAGGALDLGGFKQSIHTVNLAGGVIQNGVLFNANGITSTGGTLSQMTVSTSGTNGSALYVTGSGAHVNLLGTNSFTTQGAGAFGLYADLGASISTTGTLNVTSTNPAAAAIELRGNGASIQATGGGIIAAAGNAIEFMGGTSQTATFDNFNIGTTSGNIVFADPSTATITFNNSTVNAGTGYLLNATGGSVITFNASASTLTGAMATDPTSTSNVNLTNGTVWNLTGPSNVSSLAVTNSAIVFALPGPGGFKTLTVGNYVGSGANIILNTALGGSSSPTDQIVVNGGSATGHTYLTIRNAGRARRPDDRQPASRSSSRPTAGRPLPTPSPSPIRRCRQWIPVLARSTPAATGISSPRRPDHAAAGPVLARRCHEGAARPDRQQRLAELHPARRDAAGQLLKLRVRLRGPRLFRLGNAGPGQPQRPADGDRRFFLQPVELLRHLGLRRPDARRRAAL